MKNKLQILSAVFLVALSTSAFSAPLKSAADCPSANTIASHSNFTQAMKMEKMWTLGVEPYESQGRNWFTVLGAELDANSDVEALQQGNNLFSSIQLNAPELIEDACIYARSVSPLYFVAAFQMSGADSNFKTKLSRFTYR